MGSADLAIDMHTHPFSGEIQGFVREMDAAGVQSSAVLFSQRDPTDVDRPDVRKRIASRLVGWPARDSDAIFEQIRSHLGSLANPTNSDSGRLAATYPGRFLPFGSVHMHATGEQLESELDEIGALNLRGVKLLPTLQLFDPAESASFERVCEWCERHGKVIVYHTGCDPGPFEIPEVAEDANPERLRPVLERYSPKIVLAHFGAYSAYRPGLWFERAVEIAKEFENVYADTSAAVDFLLRRSSVESIKKNVGFDRVLFGTDYPVVGGSSMGAEARAVLSSRDMTGAEKELVMRENATRLLGL